MVKFHLKTLNAPKTWKIKRKSSVFITRPMPGGHTAKTSMPLIVIIRDFLNLAKTSSEARYIIKNKNVIINGKRRLDPKYPVGLMDVIEFVELKKQYRMIINIYGNLGFVEIPESEKMDKILKITGKSLYKGKIQLSFLGGTTCLVDDSKYKTGDCVLFNLKENKIAKKLVFEKGSIAYLFGGFHVGRIGIIEDINANKVRIKARDEKIETLKRFVIIVGKEKPLITLN